MKVRKKSNIFLRFIILIFMILINRWCLSHVHNLYTFQQAGSPRSFSFKMLKKTKKDIFLQCEIFMCKYTRQYGTNVAWIMIMCIYIYEFSIFFNNRWYNTHPSSQAISPLRRQWQIST